MIFEHTLVPIYNTELYLVIADTFEAGAAHPNLPKPLGEGKFTETCKAYCLQDNADGKYAILFRFDKLNAAFINHELWHVTGAIFSFIGEEPSWGNEAGAYLHDWITAWVYRILQDKKVELQPVPSIEIL